MTWLALWCSLALASADPADGVVPTSDAGAPEAVVPADAPAPEDAATPDPPGPLRSVPGVPPFHRLWYRSSTFARINPLGLQSILDIGWRYQLIKRPGTLYKDSYVFVGPTVNVSPSFVRGGVRVEAMPVSLLRLHAQYQGVVYTGAFDNLSSFPSLDSDFSDRAMGEGDAYVTTGGVFNVGARVQMKVGAFALRNTSDFAYWHLNLRDGDEAFYEQFWDRMIANRSFAVQNDLDLLGVVGKVRVGVRYTYSDTLLGDGSIADLANHRVGPLFSYEFHDRKAGTRFNHPTLFVLAQWWLQHAYRTGEQQPWALPLIAVGLTFDGDLVGPRPER